MVWRARRAFTATAGRSSAPTPSSSTAPGRTRCSRRRRAPAARASASGSISRSPGRRGPIAGRASSARTSRCSTANSPQRGRRFPSVPGRVIHCPVERTAAVESWRPARSLRAALGAARRRRRRADGGAVRAVEGSRGAAEGRRTLLPEPPRAHLDCRAAQARRRSRATHRGGRGARGAAPRSPARLAARRARRRADADAAGRHLLPAQPAKESRSASRSQRRCGSGLPCVVSAGGGAAELLDESCGVIVAPGDARGHRRRAAAARLRIPRLRRPIGEAAERRAAALTDPAGRIQELVDVVSCAQAVMSANSRASSVSPRPRRSAERKPAC